MSDRAEGDSVDPTKIRSRSKTATLARAETQKRKLEDAVQGLLTPSKKSTTRKRVSIIEQIWVNSSQFD